MKAPYQDQLQPYAVLLLRTGVNLQQGQSLVIRAELAHAEFVRLVVAEAYAQGAAYVHVEWTDTPTQRAMLLNTDVEAVESSCVRDCPLPPDGRRALGTPGPGGARISIRL